MIRKTILVLTIGALGAVLPAQGQLEALRAIRGDLLVGNLNGESVAFELAGVWAPTPPGLRDAPEYRGLDALGFTTAALTHSRIVVRAVGTRKAGEPIPVRVLVGENPQQDLSVMLVDAGLALAAPSAGVDEELVKAVRLAEGEARRAQRGLHDGGLQAFNWSRSTYRDLGIDLWSPNLLRVGGSSKSLSPVAAGNSSRKFDARSRPQSRSTWNHIARSSKWVSDAGLTGGR